MVIQPKAVKETLKHSKPKQFNLPAIFMGKSGDQKSQQDVPLENMNLYVNI